MTWRDHDFVFSGHNIREKRENRDITTRGLTLWITIEISLSDTLGKVRPGFEMNGETFLGERGRGKLFEEHTFCSKNIENVSPPFFYVSIFFFSMRVNA